MTDVDETPLCSFQVRAHLTKLRLDEEGKEAGDGRWSGIKRSIIFDGTDCFIASRYIHSVGTQYLFCAHAYYMEITVASIEVTGTKLSTRLIIAPLTLTSYEPQTANLVR